MSIETVVDCQTGEVTERQLSQTEQDAQAANTQAAVEVAARRKSQVNNADVLRNFLDDSLGQLRAYQQLAAPTGIQTAAVVKLLCLCVIALARLALQKLDATD